MNIPCPQCGFALIVTNRRILGRPARCPQCRTKFILRDPACKDDDAVCEAAAVDQRQTGDSVPSQELLFDLGRAYVSMEQIQRWHSKDEQNRFLRWIMDKTSALAAGGMGFFLEDYEEWLSLGKPPLK